MMKCKKEIHVVFGILFIFGTILIGTTGAWDSVYGQTNSTANQTSSPPVTTTNATSSSNNNTDTNKFNSKPNQRPNRLLIATTTTTAQEEASNSIKGLLLRLENS